LENNLQGNCLLQVPAVLVEYFGKEYLKFWNVDFLLEKYFAAYSCANPYGYWKIAKFGGEKNVISPMWEAISSNGTIISLKGPTRQMIVQSVAAW
jgi:hypothetical protein